jgi:signal transduction histidine kinase
MHSLNESRWQRHIVRLGRRNTILLITTFSVVASIVIVALFFALFSGKAEEAPMFFVPAVVVPMIVAPLASGWVLKLAFALDAAHIALTAQAERLEAMLSAAPVGIMELDADTRVRRSNEAAAAMLGPTGDAAPWDGLFLEAAERAAFLDAVRTGRPAPAMRWQWRGTTQERRLVEAHVAPIGTGTGAILIVVDVTEQEALDAALAQARQLELVGRLAAGIAHDFNNLLTTVRANLDAVRAGDHATPLEAIDDAAASGARMTRRLLALGGRAMHLPEQRSIAPIVAETIALAARLLPSPIRLAQPESLPDRVVTVDPDGLQHALLNLIVNARDAVLPGGTIRIALDEHTVDGRDWLVLSVHDDGTGMSPDVLARATELFFSTKAPHEGTGLGLSLVQETMQRFGGRLELDSAPGRGTMAALWIPDPVPAPATAATPPVLHAPPPGETSILLIDDEVQVREATERALHRLGYSVTAVSSVAEARPHLRGTRIALVVSDVMMPDETGLDLLQTMRAEGRTTPVLLVSGYSGVAADVAVAGDPQADFLAKPWSITELGGRVRALLMPVPA